MQNKNERIEKKRQQLLRIEQTAENIKKKIIEIQNSEPERDKIYRFKTIGKVIFDLGPKAFNSQGLLIFSNKIKELNIKENDRHLFSDFVDEWPAAPDPRQGKLNFNETEVKNDD